MSASTPPRPVSTRPSVDEANAAIRRFVAGRTVWSTAELAELDRLRKVWQAALRSSVRPAA